jgi:hypothetical protein
MSLQRRYGSSAAARCCVSRGNTADVQDISGDAQESCRDLVRINLLKLLVSGQNINDKAA